MKKELKRLIIPDHFQFVDCVYVRGSFLTEGEQIEYDLKYYGLDEFNVIKMEHLSSSNKDLTKFYNSVIPLINYPI